MHDQACLANGRPIIGFAYVPTAFFKNTAPRRRLLDSEHVLLLIGALYSYPSSQRYENRRVVTRVGLTRWKLNFNVGSVKRKIIDEVKDVT